MGGIRSILEYFHVPEFLFGLLVFSGFIFRQTSKRYRRAIKNSKSRARILAQLKIGGPRNYYVSFSRYLLQRLSRFFGDTDDIQPRLSSIIHLEEPRPLWTARSFEFCAVAAIVYPITALYVVWVFTGNAGPVATVLGMPDGLAGWQRTLSAAILIAMVALFGLAFRRGKRSFWIVIIIAIGICLSQWLDDDVWLQSNGIVGTDVVSVAGIVTAIVIRLGARSVLGCAAVTGALMLVAGVNLAGSANLDGLFDTMANIGLAVVAAGVGTFAVVWLAKRALHHKKLAAYWLVAWPLAVLACYLIIFAADHWHSGQDNEMLAVMIVLVPLINLPFDWASVGLSRLLLHRATENHGHWFWCSPTAMGLLDAGLSLVSSAFLAAAIVIGLSLVDVMLACFGSTPLMRVSVLLAGLKQHPDDPSNYWIYLTLGTTLIPSILNAIVGFSSLATLLVPPWRLKAIAIIEGLRKEDADESAADAANILAFWWAFGTFISLTALWLAALTIPLVIRFLYGLIDMYGHLNSYIMSL